MLQGSSPAASRACQSSYRSRRAARLSGLLEGEFTACSATAIMELAIIRQVLASSDSAAGIVSGVDSGALTAGVESGWQADRAKQAVNSSVAGSASRDGMR